MGQTRRAYSISVGKCHGKYAHGRVTLRGVVGKQVARTAGRHGRGQWPTLLIV